MAKEIVGYCQTCGRKTRHRVVECHDSVPERIFETIITMGWSIHFLAEIMNVNVLNVVLFAR